MYKATYSFLMIVLLLCSCNSPKPNPLLKEAEQKAEIYKDAILTKCGEDYYASLEWSELIGNKIVSNQAIFQFKSPVMFVNEQPIKDVDKNLNQVEFTGEITFLAAGHRVFEKNGDKMTWSSWREDVPRHISALASGRSYLDRDISKEKGRWSIGGWYIDEDKGKPKKIQCSEVSN